MNHSAHIDHFIRSVGCLVLAVFLFSPGPARAQDRIDPATRIRSWMSGQQNLLARLDTFRVTETVRHTVDGGFGRRNMGSRAIVTGGRNIHPPQREFLSFSDPGAGFPSIHNERRRRQMLSIMRPEMLRLLDSIIFPGQLLGRFRPVGPPSLDERDGIEYWRFDSVPRERPEVRERPELRERPEPRERPELFERLTAWFDTVNFSLRATHAILRLPGRARMSIRTNYETIDGLDVPTRRVIEGAIPMRRRMRMFHADFEQIIRYSDYELRFQD